MKQIPDGTIDAVISDLPYGTTDCAWDSVIPLDKLWEQYDRILTPKGTAVLFCQQPFTTVLASSRLDLLRHSQTWIKDKCSNFIAARYQPGKFTEDILVFSKGNFAHNAKVRATYNPVMVKVDFARKVETEKRCYMNECRSSSQIRNSPSNAHKQFFAYKKEDDFTQFPKNYVYYTTPHFGDERIHPTQKPVDLLRYLVLTYTNEGDTVLDNCSGSGTTAVACVKEKRHFICFEKDETYWKKSVERVKNEQRQLTLF
jgi:site-specific DNA-methyltransferase (adenine-specific)